MKKYYLKTINLNCNKSICNLRYNYQSIKINNSKKKKYYLLGINLNNIRSMNNLGYYYQYIKINYNKMKKYFLMSINLNNSDAMHNLGSYYYNIKKKYNFALKYYLLAIHNDCDKSIDLDFSKDIEITPDIIENIDPNPKFPTYINSYIKLYKQHIKLINENIDLIELQFNYEHGEIGFQEAKGDFLNKYEIKMNNKMNNIINN